jgi:hypothetical protein
MILKFFKAIENNLDFIVKTITIGGTILAMIIAILYLQADIKTQIDEQLNNPLILEKIAKQIKPPFLIFDENERVIYNDGGEEYIDLDNIKIKFDKRMKMIEAIIITTKKFLNIAPILSSIDSGVYVHDAERIDIYTWEYRIVKIDVEYSIRSNKNMKIPAGRYRLEIIR